MMGHQLSINKKNDQEDFSASTETVTIHPVTYGQISKYKNPITLKSFSLSDDPNVRCQTTLHITSYKKFFEVKFLTEVSAVYEYDISLYYIDGSEKLHHLSTSSVSKISLNEVLKFPCSDAFSKSVYCDSNDIFLLCTRILRKDIPFIYGEKPAVLSSTQITDCSLLFENDTLSNFTINIKDKEFRVHKEILAAKSPVFLAMFKGNMKERKENRVTIKGVNSEVFQELLRYCYTNTVDNLESHAENLFKAADMYDMPKLKFLCAQQLSRSLKVENAVTVLALADKHNERTLKERTIKFIKSNLQSVLQTEEYKTWCPSASPALLGGILEAIADSYTLKYQLS